MLWIKADHGFARLEDIAQKEFEQVALSLAAVAQNEHAGGSLVLSPSVQIHDDIGTITIPPNIEPVWICLPGVIEGI